MNQPVLFSCNKMTHLKVQFRSVPGIEFKDLPRLVDLTGCPSTVDTFSLTNLPALATLRGSPKVTNKRVEIVCCDALRDLKHIPSTQGRYFIVYCKKLTSVKGLNREFVRECTVSMCESLPSLVGSPALVDVFDCSCNRKLKNLRGGPRNVRHSYIAKQCQGLISLAGGPVTAQFLLLHESVNLKDVDSFLHRLETPLNLGLLGLTADMAFIRKPSAALLTAVINDKLLLPQNLEIPWLQTILAAKNTGDTLTMYGELADMGLLPANLRNKDAVLSELNLA